MGGEPEGPRNRWGTGRWRATSPATPFDPRPPRAAGGRSGRGPLVDLPRYPILRASVTTGEPARPGAWLAICAAGGDRRRSGRRPSSGSWGSPRSRTSGRGRPMAWRQAVPGVVRVARPRLAGDRAAPRGGLHPDASRVRADGEAAPGGDPGALRLARRPPGAPREPGRGGAGPEARRDEGRDAGPDAGGGAGAPWGCGGMDYFRQELRGWLRLHEKGGKRHDVPAHHRAERAAARVAGWCWR